LEGALGRARGALGANSVETTLVEDRDRRKRKKSQRNSSQDLDRNWDFDNKKKAARKENRFTPTGHGV